MVVPDSFPALAGGGWCKNFAVAQCFYYFVMVVEYRVIYCERGNSDGSGGGFWDGVQTTSEKP